MLEYASSRTICRCWSATKFPIVIVRIERAAKIGVQNSYCAGKATNISCSSPVKPAAFEAGGERRRPAPAPLRYRGPGPNGTALTLLNAKRTRQNRIAASTSVSWPSGSATDSAVPISAS